MKLYCKTKLEIFFLETEVGAKRKREVISHAVMLCNLYLFKTYTLRASFHFNPYIFIAQKEVALYYSV